MCERQQPKVKLPDLILAAICELQEKNGVEACEITQYVAKKRGCKVCQIEGMIKMILCKAKNYGILCEKKGLYRIEDKYDDFTGKAKEKSNGNGSVNLSDDSDEEENDEDQEDPCACIKFSRDCLNDDEEEENRCPGIRKKRKTCS